MLIAALVLSFGFLIALSCFPNVARTFPQNYICLGFFTLCEGYLVGAIASFYDADAVVMATGITFGIFVVLTLYAAQTKYDWTAHMGILMCFLLVLILVGFLSIWIRDLRLVYRYVPNCSVLGCV